MSRCCWLSLVGALVLAGAGCAKFGAAQGKVQGAQDLAKDQSGKVSQGADEAKKQKELFGKFGKKKKDDPGATLPDQDGDGTSLGARPANINTPIKDQLVPQMGDRIDWKVVSLQGKRGYATFQVNWDEPTADLTIEVNNEDGVNVAQSPKRTGTQSGTKLLAPIDRAGLYYVKIASNTKTATVYTFKCLWDGKQGPPPPQATGGNGAGGGSSATGGAPQQPPQQGNPPPQQQGNPPPQQGYPPPQQGYPPPQQGYPPPQQGYPPPQQGYPPPQQGYPPPQGGAQGQQQPAPPPPQGRIVYNTFPLPPPTNPLYPRGKIVQSYRDADGSLRLHLDRGSSSGLRKGMRGYVLFGPDGDGLLDGGEFRITKVNDATHSIASLLRKGLSTLGAGNTRYIIVAGPWPPPPQ